jgi:hypothetical protein
VPPAIELSAPQTFTKEGTNIVATIPPRQLAPNVSGLMRADLFVLYLIRDAYPERPFYFSRTTGGYRDEMGFTPYTVTVGLARKLMPSAPTAGNGIVAMPGDGWFDAPKTRALWETAFKAPASLAKRDLWVDRPSASIPFLYVRTGLELSTTLSQMGAKDEAAKMRAQAERIARGAQLEDVFAVLSR